MRRVQEALDGFRPSRRTAIEQVAIGDAIGRAPASPILAETALPGFTRSAVDGYAIVASDTATASREAPASLEIVGHPACGRAAP